MMPLVLDRLRVLVTREREASLEFANRLRQLGAEPVVCPAIAIVFRHPPGLDEALIGLERFDWLVVTSANAVQAVTARLKTLGSGAHEALMKVPIAVVGDATRDALEAEGGRAEIVAEPANAGQLATQLQATGVDGKLILFPASRIAQPELAQRLRSAGAGVVQLAVYDTVAPVSMEIPAAGLLDVATFTSPSTVRNVAERVDDEWRRRVPIICIGPTTANAARESGFRCPMMSREPSLDGIIAALSDFRARLL
jgi:uroporphyrinogen-III synthase